MNETLENPSERINPMAAFTHTAPLATYGEGHKGFFSSLVARYNAWNMVRKTREELNRLTDRELADVGLKRSDIDEVARAGYDA